MPAEISHIFRHLQHMERRERTGVYVQRVARSKARDDGLQGGLRDAGIDSVRRGIHYGAIRLEGKGMRSG